MLTSVGNTRLRRNPDAAAAQAALIYAWNETDEGGWLVPTRRPDGSPDTGRIAALGAVLRPEPIQDKGR